MAKVRVACRQINGLTIRCYKPGWDDGTGDGVKPIVPDGPPVVLKGPSAVRAGAGLPSRLDLTPVETEVDADFAEKWFSQNRLNPFVTRGIVYIVGKVPEPAPAAATAPAERPSVPPAHSTVSPQNNLQAPTARDPAAAPAETENPPRDPEEAEAAKAPL